MKDISKQARIDEAEKFFNLIFGAVNDADKIGYLWTKQDKATYPFKVANADARHNMAVKAIELNDAGFDVYFGVNLMDTEPAKYQRVNAEEVTLQTATITDIDCEGGGHVSKADKVYPPNFATAKTFLPFQPSIIVDSGFGAHGYCLYQEPIAITADNREDCIKRNRNFISVIRSRAGVFAKAVDGVHDLPRILRVPGTFNYKCGRENAPLCHVVEVNEIRFTPASLDAQLKPHVTVSTKHAAERRPARENHKPKAQRPDADDIPAGTTADVNDDDEPADNDARKIIKVALKYCRAKSLERDDWFQVGCVMKRYGLSLDDFDRWSNDGDPRYSAESCRQQWASMKTAEEAGDKGYKVGTLIEITQRHSEDFCKQIAADPNFLRDCFAAYTTGDPALDDALTAELKAWTKNNQSAIKPDFVAEIFDAVAFAEKLTTADFDPYDAFSAVFTRRIALLQIYAPRYAGKFFDVVAAQKNSTVTVSAVAAQVAATATPIKREQRNYQQTLRKRIAEAKRTRARDAKDTQKAENLERLNELRTQDKSPERDAEIVSLIRDSCEWTLDRYGDPVAVKATAANLHKIFTFDPYIDGLFAYNQFLQADVFLKSPPWNPAINTGDELTDRDDSSLRMYLRSTYPEFAGEKLIFDGVIAYSDKRAFHPVKDFFKHLPTWGGTPRAETIFVKLLGAQDNAFNREVTLNWLTAAVARIFHPACEYQICPIIKGAQGIGKSYILETLGAQWYSALNFDVNDPQALEVLRNSWLIEFKELKAMRKADVNSIKAFIDTPFDNYRPKYGARAKKFYRHCVFIATTNDEQFLSDETGNRRFPIIECHNPRGQFGEQPTPEYIAQVWAEVFHIYCQMFKGKFDDTGIFRDEFNANKLNLSEEAKPAVEELAQQHLRDDGLKGEIEAFLDTPIPTNIIWENLTKTERRNFFVNGNITIELAALKNRFYKPGKKRPAADKCAAFDRITTPAPDNPCVKLCTMRTPYGDVDALTFYGTEQRNHICAAEIFNEAFDTDRRKSMPRIAEILGHLDGWKKGKRIGHDSAYGNQSKVYYRDCSDPTAADDTDIFSGDPVAQWEVPV